jgi:hypothetical protein
MSKLLLWDRGQGVRRETNYQYLDKAVVAPIIVEVITTVLVATAVVAM